MARCGMRISAKVDARHLGIEGISRSTPPLLRSHEGASKLADARRDGELLRGSYINVNGNITSNTRCNTATTTAARTMLLAIAVHFPDEEHSQHLAQSSDSRSACCALRR